MKYRIKELAKEKSTTISDLAIKCGVPQTSISRIISGGSNPTIDTLEKIAEALNVNLTDLFEDEDVSGFVKIKGVIHEVNSLNDIKKLLNDMKD